MPFGDFSDRKFRKQSLNDKVSNLIKRVRELSFREHPQDMSNVYDDIIGNSFISPLDPTVVDPSAPTFTGVAIGAKGWTFGGVVHNVAGILSGVMQAGFNLLGQFVWGGGVGTLDANGMSIEVETTYADERAIKFVEGSTIRSAVYGDGGSGINFASLTVNPVTGEESDVLVKAFAASGEVADARLEAEVQFGLKNILRVSNTDTYVNYNAADVDTIIRGSGADIATFDAGTKVQANEKGMIINNGGTGTPIATEGFFQWNTTTKRMTMYDAQRDRSLSSIGWTPSALPLIYDPSAALTTAYSLAANGGTLVIPMKVTGHMLLQGVTVRNTDTGTARSWRWHLYEQYLNNGNSGENTLTRIESGSGNDSFTPAGAASNRTLNGTGAPTYLAPGVYWLAIQNVHATSTFGLASTAVGSSAFAPNSAQVKTLTVPLGSTLDLVAATWTKLVDIYAVRMNGRVFGQTTAF